MEKFLRAHHSAFSGNSILRRSGILASLITLLVLVSSFTNPVIKNKLFATNTLDKLGLTSSTTAAGAYSLRLLSSNYNGALVRITIGTNFYDVYPDATIDHAFSLTSPVSAAYSTYNATSTGVTGTALSDVIGSNSATVATWYDQGGNGRDGVQGNSFLQPQIINAGTINTTNSKPALKFTGGQWLVVTTTAFNANLSGSVVYKATNANTTAGGSNTWYIMNGIVGSEQGGDITDFSYGVYNNKFTAGFGVSDNSVGSTTTVNDGTTRITSWTRTNSTGSISLFNNGATDGGATLAPNERTAVPSVAIGAVTVNGGGNFNGTISEIALFPVVYNTTERQAIEASQSTYYSTSLVEAQITTSGDLTALTTTHGTASASTSFNVSGSNMSAGILVTPPAGYEVSTNNSSFSSTITVGTGGTITSTPVYVRLSGANYGTYSGNIILSSTGATDATVATIPGIVTPVAADFPSISYGTAKIIATNNAITPIAPTVAQVNSFGYGGYTSFGNEVVQAKRILKDSQGNLYVLDQAQFKIYKYPANGGASVEVSPGANNYPYSLTIDAADNLYFSDLNDLTVKKIAANTGTVTVVASGFNTAYNIAAASDGTIYVVEIYDNVIKKIPPGGGTIVTVGTGFNAPLDVAVDSYGNVYVADQGNGKLKKIYMSTDGHTEDLGDVGQPFSVTVDKADNVFVGDAQNFRIYGFPANGSGRQLILSGTDYQVTDGLYVENGVVYVASSSHRGVYVTKPIGGYFMGNALPAGLSFDQATGIISGTPTVISAAKDYTVTAYNSAGGASAAVNIRVGADNANLSALAIAGVALNTTFVASTLNYTASVISTVASVDITPTLADGTATITYNGNPVTSGSAVTVPLVSGANVIPFVITTTGGVTKTYTITVNKSIAPTVTYAPQTFAVNTAITPLTPTATNVAAFAYGGAIDFGGPFTQIGNIKKDKLGNTYMLDVGVYKIYKYAPNSNTGVEIGTDGAYPSAITVDDAGNLYLADAGYGIVKKIEAGTGAVSTIANGVSYAFNMSMAKDGTIYLADGGSGSIKKILPGSNTAVAIGISFDNATDMVVDNDGNLYVADQNNMAIKKIWLSTDSHVETVYNGSQVISLAFDKANNLFAGDPQYSRLLEIPADGSGVQTVATGSAYQYPGGIYVDDKGLIYVATYLDYAKVVAPTGGYFIDSTLPKGLSFDQNTGAISGTPTITSPATPYHITAYNGAETGTGTANIGVVTDLDLTNLLTDVGALTPVFDADVTSYQLTVSGGTTSANITATLNKPANTLTVNGVAATSASPASVALNIGDNNIPVVVTSPVDNSTKTYTVNIHRISNVYKLANLTSNAGSLNPVFDPDVTNYTINVPYGTTTATLTPTLADTFGSVKVNDVLATSGSPSQNLNLNIGDNNFEVRSTAEDGTSAIIYNVTIQRADPIVVLSGLTSSTGTIAPAFNGDVTGYGITVPAGTLTVNLTPALADAAATVTVNGTPVTSGVASTDIALNPGFNPISVVFTAANGTTIKTYTVIVNRLVTAPVAGDNAVYTFTKGAAITPTVPGFIDVAAPGYNAIAEPVGAVNTPTGIAVDKAGNLFVASVGDGTVQKLPAAGGTPEILLSGLNTALGVATDAEGNVYVAALGNNTIKKIAVGTNTVTNIGTALAFPTGITLDTQGNIYVSETINGVIKKMSPDGSSITVLATGITQPYGLSVDAAGNVYVADAIDNKIIKITPGGIKTDFITGLSGPTDIKIDDEGNFYIADAGTNTIIKYNKDGLNPVNISIGYQGLFGLAIGTSGQLYNTDNFTQMVNKVNFAGGYTISDPLPAGLLFDNATGIISGTPTVTTTAKDYTITGYNSGGAASAVVNISVELSADASLSALSISNGTLAPVFDSNNITYTAALTSGASSVKVTPVANHPDAVTTVNGNTVAYGQTSAAIPLVIGENSIPVVVTAADGHTVKTYTIHITRVSNNVSTSFKIDPVSTLVSTTGTADYNYTTTVNAAIGSITITPVSQDINAVVTINGQTVASGAQSLPITLNGVATPVNITVTAANGFTIRTYSIVVTRTGSSNAYAGFKLSPSSALTATTGDAKDNYVTSVDPSVSSVTVTPITSDEHAAITVNGAAVVSNTPSLPISLSVGATLINIVITAENGTTVRTYSITVNRTGSTNTSASFRLNPSAVLTTTTGLAKVNYATTVNAATTSVKIIPVPQDENAVVKINGEVVAANAESQPITLDAGPTTINMLVTAPNGVNTRTYSITVTRTGSSNARASFKLTPSSALTATTGDADDNYVTSVAPSTSSVTVTPVTSDPNATVTVNGVPVAGNTASLPVTLNTGPTLIGIVVTAQNGITTRTYSILVNRTGSTNTSATFRLSPAAALTATTGDAKVNYATSVSTATGSITVTPIPQDANATITINGETVAANTASQPIILNDGPTLINMIVTAPNGVNTRTYSITVNRNGSNNAFASFRLTPAAALTVTTGTGKDNYAATANAATGSITVMPITSDANATVTINDEPVASGAQSSAITLNTGLNIIYVIVTAQDGTTTRTYNLYITRESNTLMTANKLQFVDKAKTFAVEDNVVVHQGVSPNGDGSNDFLYIEGISAYSNKLSIMNNNGTLVFETKDYGSDGTNLFDGHSNKNGTLLKPGTYFYSLEYKVGKQYKRKTGYIILKY